MSISMEEFLKGELVQEGSASELSSSDVSEYETLVRDRATTPAKLNKWLTDKGYDTADNAAEILTFARRNPDAPVKTDFNNRVVYADTQPESAAEEESWLDPVGLGARNLLEGAGSLADIVAGPLNALVNALPGEQGMTTTPFRDLASWGSDALGLDEAETDQEKLNSQLIEGGVQGLLTAGAGMTLAGAKGLTGVAGAALADAPISQVVGSAAGAGAGEVARQNDVGVAGQLAANLLGGAAGTAGSLAIASRLRPRPNPVTGQPEFDPADLPEGITPEQAQRALDETRGLQMDAENFRPAPEPTAEALFKQPEAEPDLSGLEAQLAREAEAFRGRNVDEPAPEAPYVQEIEPVVPPSGRDETGRFTSVSREPLEQASYEGPVRSEVVEAEPSLSRKEADALFGEVTARPKPQTAKEWERNLQASAKAHLEEVDAEIATQAAVKEAAGEPVEVPPAVAEAAAVDDVVSRLTTALKSAGKASETQREMYRQERSARLKEVAKARNTLEGRDAYNAELAALSGEMKKVDFEDVSSQFTPEEIDSLFTSIQKNPNLTGFGAITARTGLRKLFEGQVPNPSELTALSKALPTDFVKAAMQHRSKGQKMTDLFSNVLNLPRSLMSTLDLSGPLRQGVFMVGNKNFYKALKPMVEEFAYSFKKGDGPSLVEANIRARPTYELMERSGLAIDDASTPILSNREEAFQSQWAERIPVIGKLARASNAAYSGFLHKLRADVFDDLVAKAQNAGIDVNVDEKALRDMARFINAATGRGDLGKNLNQAAPMLNGLFFSPRLIASRVNLLNPQFYMSLDPLVRKEAVKSLLSFGGIALSVMGLAKLGGMDVEIDPRSSDFGKLRNGNTRYDILGGFGQYVTLGARLVTNERKSLGTGRIAEMGKDFGAPSRFDTIVQFGTNKTAPVPSYVIDYFRGKNAVGEEFDPVMGAVERMVPLFWSEVVQAVNEDGAVGGLKQAPGLFGVGVQTFDTEGRNSVGRKVFDLEAKELEGNPVVAELDRLQGTLEDGKTILGKVHKGSLDKFKATEEQVASYQKLSNEYIQSYMLDAMADESWSKMSDEDKVTEFKEIVKDMRAAAREELFPEYYGQGAVEEATPEAVGQEVDTTFENGVASFLLEDLGLTVTDEGIRSAEDQKRFSRNFSGVARPGTSAHEFGQALDVRVPSNGTTVEEIKSTLESNGYRGVRIVTQRHGSGPHWHIQWDEVV